MENLEHRNLLTAAVLTYNSISDGSFEAPALASNTWQVPVTQGSSPWQFSGLAGISTNASNFTNGCPNAPSGSQVALIKDNGSISQTVYLLPGVYSVSFLAVQRVNYQTQNQVLQVKIDGTPVGLPITPAGLIPPNNTIVYTAYQTPGFTVTATATGTHVLAFQGLAPTTADSTAFIDEVAIVPMDDSISDGGFEQPALPSNAYQTDASGTAWTFTGTAGVARNGSDFVTNWTVAQNAPAGWQVGYIQEYGKMSQTVFLDAGTYEIALLAAQRQLYQTHYQEIQVKVDGLPYGIINPVNILYGSYYSSTFAVAAGPHTIEFDGLDPLGNDNTAFIDQVTIFPNAVNDSSFETPALNGGASQAAPGGLPWQFTGTAGVAHNGSAITQGNPVAPDGTQVAYIQNTGGMSQSVALEAGSYNISFLAAQGAKNSTYSQQIKVLIDNTQIGLITPVSASYGLYETANFTVTTGPHNLQFLGLNPQGGNNTVLMDEVLITASQDVIIDGGFEAPALGGQNYQAAPNGTPWQFAGSAGITANGSALTFGSSRAPQGAQAGFIMNNGSMSYSVYLDAETYNLSFLADQRATYQTQAQQIQVWVDNTVVALITPSSTNYYPYQTSNFTVASGVHVIKFVGMTPASGESTAFIDQVALSTMEDSFSGGSFEAPVLAANTWQVAPSGSAWQFTGLAGVSTNNSNFTSSNSLAPAGVQVAFIKDQSSMSQTVYFDAGAYNISFLAAQRLNHQTQSQQIQVWVDNTIVGTITPTNTTASPYYVLYETPSFRVTAGPHNVQLVGTSPFTADSTAFIDDATISMGGGISDGSFEDLVLPVNTYQYAPSGTAWQFSAAAGISTNKSHFTDNNPNAPDGYQVAFIQGTATMSQSVDMDAGLYNLSFMAAQRGGSNQSSYLSLAILVDGVQVGTATPAANSSSTAASILYGLYQTTSFTVTAGVHVITFVGLNPSGGDNTAFIDEVQLTTANILG
jgi:hypothetical protein